MLLAGTRCPQLIFLMIALQDCTCACVISPSNAPYAAGLNSLTGDNSGSCHPFGGLSLVSPQLAYNSLVQLCTQ